MESWKLPQLEEQLRELSYAEPRDYKLIARIKKEIERIEYEKVEEEFLARHARQVPPSHWEDKKMSADAPEFVFNPPTQPQYKSKLGLVRQSDLPKGKGKKMCPKCGLPKS